jgi:uncharacterized protein YdiU (UPF0061 family)
MPPLPTTTAAYRQQPEVCQWNLAQLANALLAAGLAGQEALEQALADEYAGVRGGWEYTGDGVAGVGVGV